MRHRSCKSGCVSSSPCPRGSDTAQSGWQLGVGAAKPGMLLARSQKVGKFVVILFWRARALGGSHGSSSSSAEAQGQAAALSAFPSVCAAKKARPFLFLNENKLLLGPWIWRGECHRVSNTNKKPSWAKTSPVLLSHSLAVNTRDSSWLVWEWEGTQSPSKKCCFYLIV